MLYHCYDTPSDTQLDTKLSPHRNLTRTIPSPTRNSCFFQTFSNQARRALRRHTKSSSVSGVASALDEEMEMMAEDDDETPLGADAGNFEAEAIPAVGMG